MALPTRDQLHDAVDLDFFDRYPDAPRRLDPNDPAQADLVAAWNEICRVKANEWTDEAFWKCFPDAGHLSADGPEDALLREYWRDIRNQITGAAPGKYNWDDCAPAAAPSDQQPLSLVSVRQVERSGYVLTFSREVGLADALQWVWPDGTPGGILTASVAPTEVKLADLSLDALRSMRSDVAVMIHEAGILTAE